MSDTDVELVLVGDSYVQRPDPDSAFAYAGDYLRAADITFGNLETVVADPQHLVQQNRRRGPRTDEWMFDAYVRAGFNVMNLANNPSMFQGVEGLLRTIAVMDKAGIAHAGGGRNLQEARKPAIVERKSTRVAFVCRTSVFATYAPAGAERGGVAVVRVSTAYEPPHRLPEMPGMPPIIHTYPDSKDVVALQEDVQAARNQADVVVVSWHWGVSPVGGGTGTLVGYQAEMGHAAVDAGADLVVGHHPHLIQPIEVYKGKVIFYGLANFVHDLHPWKIRETIMARCRIRDRRISEVSYVPGEITDQNQPRLFKPADLAHIVKHTEEISAPFGTVFDVKADEVVVRTEKM
jgi:poly-gamma-glutamate synthesis protein (capsule biosynthesis protein)